jgi:hypothetical protein
VLLSFIIVPGWLGEWRAAAPVGIKYRGPATTVLGSVLLLALLRWRRREGRLFVTLSIVPQLPLFYDQLPLWLVPSTLVRSLMLTAASWVGYLAFYGHAGTSDQSRIALPWVVFTVYAPALVMLLMLPPREQIPDDGRVVKREAA